MIGGSRNRHGASANDTGVTRRANASVNRSGRHVQYTLWSRDRLLGETDLGFAFRERGIRCGWFHPNELGERVMPIATGVAPALRVEWAIGPDQTARADVRAAADRLEALGLELRRLDGVVVDTTSIAITDTHYLLSLPPDDTLDEYELTAEQEAEIDEMMEELREEWGSIDNRLRPVDEETLLPRYQIQIELAPNEFIP
jgi:hypothetical protein